MPVWQGGQAGSAVSTALMAGTTIWNFVILPEIHL